jgi:hypothetical protein
VIIIQLSGCTGVPEMNLARVEVETSEFESLILITNALLEFSRSFFAHFERSRMMQTRAGSYRRQKVTVRWLPVELIIEIFRRVQGLLGRKDFSQAPCDSMNLDQEYCNNLQAFALSTIEWTAIAQAELLRNIILKNRSKMRRFLEALRGSQKLQGFSRGVKSLKLASAIDDNETEELGDDLVEISLYCPDVVEISCFGVNVRLESFRTSFHCISCEEGC